MIFFSCFLTLILTLYSLKIGKSIITKCSDYHGICIKYHNFALEKLYWKYLGKFESFPRNHEKEQFTVWWAVLFLSSLLRMTRVRTFCLSFCHKTSFIISIFMV